MKEQLLEIYRHSDVAYTGQHAIYKRAKADGVPGVTMKNVGDFLRTRMGWVQQLRPVKKFRRAKVFAADVRVKYV